jgi:hypothetical protein
MTPALRCLPRAASRAARPLCAPILSRSFSHVRPLLAASSPQQPHQPLSSPGNSLATVKSNQVPLGTAKRLPEFNLAGKVVLVSGAGRGLGLVQAEALLEAGATGLCTCPSIFPFLNK